MQYDALIGLGGNLGQPERTLAAAVAEIGRLPGCRVAAVSRFHQTKPVGGPPGQADYCNAALRLQTALAPHALLTALLDIEKQFGRRRDAEQRFGPRTLDLDLLLVGDQTLHEPGLTLPHPRMHQRRFVLAPLAEVAPEALHPTLKKTVAELLADLPP